MTSGAFVKDGPAGCDPHRPFALPAFRLLRTATVVACVAAFAQKVAAARMMVTVGSALQVALIQSPGAAGLVVGFCGIVDLGWPSRGWSGPIERADNAR